jgi:hypothetical protein
MRQQQLRLILAGAALLAVSQNAERAAARIKVAWNPPAKPLFSQKTSGTLDDEPDQISDLG